MYAYTPSRVEFIGIAQFVKSKPNHSEYEEYHTVLITRSIAGNLKRHARRQMKKSCEKNEILEYNNEEVIEADEQITISSNKHEVETSFTETGDEYTDEINKMKELGLPIAFYRKSDHNSYDLPDICSKCLLSRHRLKTMQLLTYDFQFTNYEQYDWWENHLWSVWLHLETISRTRSTSKSSSEFLFSSPVHFHEEVNRILSEIPADSCPAKSVDDCLHAWKWHSIKEKYRTACYTLDNHFKTIIHEDSKLNVSPEVALMDFLNVFELRFAPENEASLLLSRLHYYFPKEACLKRFLNSSECACYDSESHHSLPEPFTTSKTFESLVHQPTDAIVQTLNRCASCPNLSNPQKVLVPTAEAREDPDLKKFWHQRYNLFYRFDDGIQLDRESWYSVTRESLAEHHATRLKCSILLDAFCGAGGNAIQFAKICEKVIAVDLDPVKIALARKNATVYGVAHKIDFVVGDCFVVMQELAKQKKRVDVVFLSPPWGGPNCMRCDVYNMHSALVDTTALLTSALRLTQEVALFLPKRTNVLQIMNMAQPNDTLEIEQNCLGEVHALTVYFGLLVHSDE